MDECQVCQKHKLSHFAQCDALFEDAYLFVSHFPLLSSEPCYLGHLLLEFRRHLTNPAEMTGAEAEAFGRATQKICANLEEQLSAEHVYIYRIGDKTPHLHFHFVPRYKNTPQEFWNLNLNRWPAAEKGTTEKIAEVTSLLRRHWR